MWAGFDTTMSVLIGQAGWQPAAQELGMNCHPLFFRSIATVCLSLPYIRHANTHRNHASS
jgi:hypothetical protein